MIKLHDLHPADNSTHKSKRLGQGPASGKGKTAGKGHKGDKARAGGGVKPGFEGGQMPLTRRTPKRGFNNARFAKVFQIVNLDRLETKFENNSEITPKELFEARLIQDVNKPVKILANGNIAKSFKITAHAFSKGAISKIEAAGGSSKTEE